LSFYDPSVASRDRPAGYAEFPVAWQEILAGMIEGGENASMESGC
jgi:hypothetical protein